MYKISPLDIYLSVECALSGEITPNVRAINVEYGDDWIRIYFYYDLEPSDWEKETPNVIATEVSCDFDYKIPTLDVRAETIQLRYPLRIPKCGIKMYQRYESISTEMNEELSLENIVETKIVEISRINALISTETALLGRVTPNLRWVCGKYGKDYIFFIFYYDKEPSELERALADQVCKKVALDFKNVEFRFKIEKICYPFPKRLFQPFEEPPENFFTSYHRYERIPERSEIENSN